MNKLPMSMGIPMGVPTNNSQTSIGIPMGVPTNNYPMSISIPMGMPTNSSQTSIGMNGYQTSSTTVTAAKKMSKFVYMI